MKRPNFFIVGAPKCGTTAWVDYLSTHPQICFSSDKEPHYFNTDMPGFRWAKTEAEYLAYFQDCTNASVVAEGSVQYLFSMEAAANIHAFCPDAKILVMLRQPSSFMRSYHNQLMLNCDETVSDLRRAWNLSEQRRAGDIPDGCRDPRLLDYKRVGLFSEHVARYFEQFGPEQVKVVFMEDWKSDPRSLYLSLISFLGLEDAGKTDFQKVHEAKHISSGFLNRMTKRPPKALKLLSKAVKQLPGLKSASPSQALRRLNTRKGYAEKTQDSALLQEIDTYFAEDQKRLREMLGRGESARP